MIPETAHLGKINLYECTSFPGTWKLKKTLFNNVHAADNAIIKYNGLYWLFSLFYVNGEHYFRIFYAESLIGEWEEHKLVNQTYGLTSNTKLTRGAGSIISINNKLIRPAQYSEKGINGEAVILYEIEKLTPDEYIEKPIKLISKYNLPSIRAIHTLSLCGDMLTIDARLERNHDSEFNIEENKDMQEIIEKNYYVNHELLEKAFDYNTSGNGKCYYSATINGKKYNGERNWDERWSLLKNCIDFNNKNVLDIGCNMGIFLTYLKKFKNIKNALGIDEPDELLKLSNKSETINSAKLLSSGFGVDISFKQIDINKENYEEIIGCNFDIVIAMSIYKWINDKDRFLKYLSNFNNILYEGHGSDEEEINRFSQFGYNYKIIGKTQTGLSYDENNTRTIIVFYK
jgi:2-polyprenyl-3-methyl-5-hydroxy-6-metoxy-1,4-benzoquinol methylase